MSSSIPSGPPLSCPSGCFYASSDSVTKFRNDNLYIGDNGLSIVIDNLKLIDRFIISLRLSFFTNVFKYFEFRGGMGSIWRFGALNSRSRMGKNVSHSFNEHKYLDVNIYFFNN